MDSVMFVDPRQYLSVLDFDLTEFDLGEGLVAVGGKLNIGTLFQAYRHGVFPWPQENLPLLWFSPDPRGVLFFDQLHLSSSLRKDWKKMEDTYTITFNKDFPRVVKECQSQPRPGQNGTWILPEMLKAYVRFHESGFAHSIECWKGEDLVAGVYGVMVEGVFSGESMFHKEDNTSKFALVHLVEKLKSLHLQWMDIQMVTPVTASLGGREIPRKEYMSLVLHSQKRMREIWLNSNQTPDSK